MTRVVYMDMRLKALLASGTLAKLNPTANSPVDRRSRNETIRTFMRPPIHIHEVRDLRVGVRHGELPARLYRPSARSDHELVIYFHGGGWQSGSLDLMDAPVRRLARDADVVILSLDYRLAPEHPFPAALQDAFDAVSWAHAHREEYGCSDRWLAVAGDSAGGNLAAAVCQLARDHDGPPIAHQLLVYPVVTPAFKSESYGKYGDGHFLTTSVMKQYWREYAGDAPPVYADLMATPTLSGLPSASVITCSLDPLSSEQEWYTSALAEAGVRTLHVRLGGLIHGSWAMDAVGEAAHAVGSAAAWALSLAKEP